MSARWRSARRCSAPSIRTRREPQQPRPPAAGPGRPRGGAAALRARAGDPREGARPRASRTATSLNNLADLLQAQGDLAAARPLFERALAIGEKVLGPEHPDTCDEPQQPRPPAADQGDLAAARPLIERALAIREKVLGPEASEHSDEPQQPRLPAAATRATWRRRGRSSSARWRSARRCSAPGIPTQKSCGTISRSCRRDSRRVGKPLQRHKFRPHPEEPRVARRLEGWKQARTCGHPSRRALRALLRMRAECVSNAVRFTRHRHLLRKSAMGGLRVRVSKDGPRAQSVLLSFETGAARPELKRGPADFHVAVTLRYSPLLGRASKGDPVSRCQVCLLRASIGSPFEARR